MSDDEKRKEKLKELQKEYTQRKLQLIKKFEKLISNNNMSIDKTFSKGLYIIKMLDNEGKEKEKDGKFLYCFGLGGKILNISESIYITEEEKDFLKEHEEEYKILFSVENKWFWSDVKKIEAGKDGGYQCKVEFNTFKFFEKSKQKQNFVHLHNHGDYSIVDGCCKIEHWIDECYKKGFDSLALTDHGTLGGTLEFYIECTKKGIIPILGYEAYITSQKNIDEKIRGYNHLTLLAKNEIGFRNLLKINTYAQSIGYYYKPRINKNILKKRGKGLIILTGCLVGKMYRLLLIGDYIKAESLYNFYCSCVGEDNVYLEIQIHDFPEDIMIKQQKTFHENLIEFRNILKKKGRKPKIVLTNDCHYPSKEDFEVWRAVSNINSSKEDRNSELLSDLYLKTREELWKDFNRKKKNGERILSTLNKKIEHFHKEFDEWCENTIKIKEKCKDLKIPIGKHNLPTFNLEGTGFKTKEELFDDIIKKGFDKKVINKICKGDKEKIEIYKQRIEIEKAVVIKAGYIDYFLIIWDIVKNAKDNGIYVGLARGSVAGSLLAFVMDITTVDPIRFNLMFERFLNETRVSGERAKDADSLPDIDLDFESAGRDWVKQYIENKYGKENVSSLTTYGYLQLRSAIKDIAKFYSINFEKINRITKQIYGNNYSNLLEAMSKSEEVSNFVKDHSDMMKIVERCIGQVRHHSIHAAGVIISPNTRVNTKGKVVKATLDDFVPVRTGKLDDGTETFVTEWEGEFVERRGLLKLDILGIKQLDIMKYINELIVKNYGEEERIVFEDIPLDDKEVYKKFSEGDTEGVFQFKSNTQRQYQKKLKPENIEHLIASNALIRPGPMGSGAHDLYVKIKEGEAEPEFDKGMKSITKDTFGLYIYQEQVMQAFVKAGLTLTEADLIRTYIKKFKSKEIAKFKPKFVKGMMEKFAYKEKKALKVWDKLLAFGDYGFNRSHSCSYAILGYQTQWLKVHYPKEFWMANLDYSSDDDRIECVNRIMTSYSDSINIIFPDINLSNIRFSIRKDDIVWSLSHIKGVGEKASIAIIKARGKKKFESLKDFYDRVEKRVVNKRVFISLILSGCFDRLYSINPKEPEQRFNLIVEYFKIKKEKELLKKESRNFYEAEFKRLLNINLMNWEELIANHPQLHKGNYFDLETLQQIQDGTNVWVAGLVVKRELKEYKNGNGYFGVVTIQQNGESCDLLLWNESWDEFEKKIKIGKPIAFFGKKKYDAIYRKRITINSLKSHYNNNEESQLIKL